MGSQNKLEQVLRSLHVLVQNSPAVDGSTTEIRVNKRILLEHLNRLGVAIYEVMDEYEMTREGRDRAEREMRRRTSDIVKGADNKAEDVYAASILYTNEALDRIQYIMQDTMDSFELACRRAVDLMEKEKHTVQANQTELLGQLRDLKDTEKYLRLMEDTNRRIDREREAERMCMEGQGAPPSPQRAKPEIRINPQYFERTGTRMEAAGGPPPDPDAPTGELKKEAPQIIVNTDAAYFRQAKKQEEAQTGKDQPEEKQTNFFKKLIRG